MVGARRAAFVLPVLAMAGCAVFDRFPELADDAPGPLASDAATTDSASADTAEPEDAGCPSCDADAGSLTGKYAFSATVLSDEQVGQVLSYLRASWGHQAPQVSTLEVSRYRSAR